MTLTMEIAMTAADTDLPFYPDEQERLTRCDCCGRPLDPADGGFCPCQECGMTEDGYCTLAGTEFCDWECPYS